MLSEDIAVFAGYMCAVYPPFILVNSDFGASTIYLTLLGFLMLVLLRIKKTNSKASSILAGFIAAVLSLTRGEGIIIAIGLCAWMLFNIHISRILIFSFTLLIFISPWIIRNYIVLEGFLYQ